ncbi:head completion/stabilization protein [Gammaproteobacteria bacterium AS21]
MSAFLVTGQTTEDSDIVNDVFYPAISPCVFRELMRLDNSVTNPRVRHALIDAMGKVNADLDEWRTQQQDLNYLNLSQVPAAIIDSKSLHEHDYQRAVFCLAKSEITERYQDYDSTASGISRAEEMEASIDDYRRQARFAIRRILGKPQATVELI